MAHPCVWLRSAGSIAAAAAVASTYAGSDDGLEHNVTPSILRKTVTSYKPGDGANVPWRPPGPRIYAFSNSHNAAMKERRGRVHHVHGCTRLRCLLARLSACMAACKVLCSPA